MDFIDKQSSVDISFENSPDFQPIDPAVEKLGKEVVDSSLKVHRALGPGLLESVYELCLSDELVSRGLRVRTQVGMPVRFNNRVIETGFKIDLLIENNLIVELKAVDHVLPIHRAQVMTYLKLMDRRLGFLINFNVRIIKDGIERIVL